MKVLAKIAKIKVAAVSYLNTIPFIHGIDNSSVSEMIDLRLGNPYKCFQMFQKNEVDVALVPVGSLPSIGNCKIIKPFCIGADGKVGSVFLLSDSSPENIKTVYYDLHSLTSNKLAEILCHEHWKIDPVFSFPECTPPPLQKNEAFVAIGDKSFKLTSRFKYAVDMSEEWKKMTGEAFVFAVWITKLNLHPSIIQGFNEALSYGVNNIHDSIVYARPEILPTDETLDYLIHKISFQLNDRLMEGMSSYLDRIMPEWRDTIEFISS
jgi:chorismate dehydratase